MGSVGIGVIKCVSLSADGKTTIILVSPARLAPARLKLRTTPTRFSAAAPLRAGWQESNRQPATAPHPLQRQRAAGWPWSDFPVLYQRRRLAGAKQLRPPRVLRKPQEQIAAPIPTAD